MHPCNAGHVVKEPWYLITLNRIDQTARGLCPVDPLRALGERFSSGMIDIERLVIVAELDHLLHKNSNIYNKDAVTYLIRLRNQMMQQPWHLTILGELDIYARDRKFKRSLVDSLHDLLSSEMTVNEHSFVVYELDQMLQQNRQKYDVQAVQYLELLLVRLRTGF